MGVTTQLHDTACRILGLGSYNLQTGTTSIPSRPSYKPGGILSLIHGPLRGRILEWGKDLLGRWLYTKLRWNMGPPITIIVMYQVVTVDPYTSGPTTYATQLFASYIKQQRLLPHELRMHHADNLIKFIQQLQQQGDQIIIAGNFNEELGHTTGGLT